MYFWIVLLPSSPQIAVSYKILLSTAAILLL